MRLWKTSRITCHEAVAGHALFLWFVFGNVQLSEAARNAIEDEASTCFLSMASVWEMAVKVSIGKLPLEEPLDVFIPDQLQRNGIQLLPIHLAHALRVASLPFVHKDPFDRLIIAQGLVEPMPIVSADVVFDDYGVVRLW